MAADGPEREAGDDLPSAIERHGLQLPPDQVARLEQYCHLLWEWNEKLNLTRHTTFDKFVGRDLIDTLKLAELLAPKERVLDVGTGGGVPGIPLAIVRPDLKVAMVESVGKKARAVEDIVAQMNLRAKVYHARVQELLPRQQYDTLVVRAVGRIDKLLTWLKPHWKRFGRLLLIKGPAWVEERGAARHKGLMHGLELRRLTSYPLAGTDSESVILQIRPEPQGA